MLSFGIIAVFKVISLKTGDGELHRPCLFSEFFPQFPCPAATSETPELVARRGWKSREMLQRSNFFKEKISEWKWNVLNLTESSVCTFEVQSFNCALCKTHQAESHHYNINILLKNLQVKMNGSTLEICFLFWPKALVWERDWEAMCKPALFCHIFGSACSDTRKAAKLYGKKIQCSCKTLGINLYFGIGKLRHKECG